MLPFADSKWVKSWWEGLNILLTLNSDSVAFCWVALTKDLEAMR